MTGPVPLGAGAGSDPYATPAVVVYRDGPRAHRVEAPAAPGWTAFARTPTELARAIEAGMAEHSVAAYAASRQQPYDLTLHDQASHDAAMHHRGVSRLPVDPDARESVIAQMACAVVPLGSDRPVTSTGRPLYDTNTYDPLAWRELDDGRWVSPGGRYYGGDTQAVRQVVAKRLAAGIGTMPGLPADLSVRREAMRQAMQGQPTPLRYGQPLSRTQALVASMAAHPSGKGHDRHLRSVG